MGVELCVSFSYDFWPNQIVGFNWRKRLVCTLVDDVRVSLLLLNEVDVFKKFGTLLFWLYQCTTSCQHAVRRRKSARGRDIDRVFNPTHFCQLSSFFPPSLLYPSGFYAESSLFISCDRWRIERNNTINDPSLSKWNSLDWPFFSNERMFGRIGLIRLDGQSMLLFVSILGDFFLDYHVVFWRAFLCIHGHRTIWTSCCIDESGRQFRAFHTRQCRFLVSSSR